MHDTSQTQRCDLRTQLGDTPIVKLCVKAGILRTVTKKKYVYVFWGLGQRRRERRFLKLAFFFIFL